MKRYTLNIKEIELKIHHGNYNRRVKYNKKDFDILVVSVLDDKVKRYFAIPVEILPSNDSIHLVYNPFTKEVQWSPRIDNVIEITNMF